MSTLHTFGCSITQGFALPDVVRELTHSDGRPMSDPEIANSSISWSDIHILAPSKYSWPAVLGRRLDMPVVNHARRGACFTQIARQCASAQGTITSEDTVIVMWTYLSRLSLQWPARTAVPFANQVDTNLWQTVILGINKLFGLERASQAKPSEDQVIQQWLEQSTHTWLDPMSVYDQYYRNLVLAVMTAGYLESTGARVIHLSVEPENYLQQLEQARRALPSTLRAPYNIPKPESWYTLEPNHSCASVILDPAIPLAPNDMHPSVEHHEQFAQWLQARYFV